MNNSQLELERLIAQEVQKLVCEIHPSVCNLRENNYAKLEQLILDEINGTDESISVQTAIANIEAEY